MRNTIIILLLIISVVSCQLFKKKVYQNHNLQSIDTFQNIDTAKVLKLLQFTDDDSMYIHIPKNDTENIFHFEDKYLRARLSNNPQDPRILDVHYALSIYRGPRLIDYGSFVVLYKDTCETAIIKRLQGDSIEIFLSSLSMYSPQLNIEDINYDGFKDIIISYSANAPNNNLFNYFWSYNSSRKEYIEDTVMNDLFFNNAIDIDYDHKEISCGGISGATGWGFSIYKWNGKTYEEYARKSGGENMEGTARVSMREELINGVWKVVKADTEYYK